MYNYFQTETENERFLRQELEDLRADHERERERQEQERMERQREREERYEENLRTASSWPEALQKQITLIGRELNSVFWGKPLYEDRQDEFFTPQQQACRRALEIWPEVEQAKAEEIKALEAQIEAIRDGIRLEIADKLRSEDNRHGWTSVADALEEEDLNNWLYW